jgi:hypothetical protein
MAIQSVCTDTSSQLNYYIFAEPPIQRCDVRVWIGYARQGLYVAMWWIQPVLGGPVGGQGSSQSSVSLRLAILLSRKAAMPALLSV